MDSEIIKNFVNHRVKIYCINSIAWHGKILKIYEDSLLLNDKYGHHVIVKFSSINSIEDLGGIYE